VLTELRHKRTRTSAYLVKFNISQQNMGCGRLFAAIDADFRGDCLLQERFGAGLEGVSD